MTTPLVAPDKLGRAYPVFLEHVDEFDDTPIDVNYVLDAIAKAIPDEPPKIVIEVFQRCAALSELLDNSPALYEMINDNDAPIFKAAAVCEIIAKSDGGYTSHSFDE